MKGKYAGRRSEETVGELREIRQEVFHTALLSGADSKPTKDHHVLGKLERVIYKKKNGDNFMI